MKLVYILCIFLIVRSNEGALTKSILKPLIPSEDYTNFVNFDEDSQDQYNLYWKYDEDEIQLEVHCKTTGWVGLGISSNGGMAGSDLIIGWVDKFGKPQVKDCYATGFTTPMTDDEQNIELIDGAQIDGYTILKYKRKLVTCDTKHDLNLNIGTIRLIAAWNDQDPITGLNDWKYHGLNRVIKSLILLNYRNEKIEDQNILPDDILTYEIQVPNITIAAKDTYYYCDIFEFPSFDQDVHLIQFEVLINKTNKKYVHHIVGYGCNEGFVPSEKLARECGSMQIPDEFLFACQDVTFSWSVGANYKHSFPSQAGMLFESEPKKRYVMLEMHYDNPQLETGRIDDTRVKLIYTKKLREHNLGVLALESSQMHIPPNMNEMRVSTTCYPECTQQFLPEDGITVVSGHLHTHLAGRKIRTSIVRNKTEIGYLFDDQNYDFNYQYIIDREPIKLYKGDGLITECTYNTIDRNKLTTFGFSTRDEMCIDFVYYYPKIADFPSCRSGSSPDPVFEFYRSLIKEGLIEDLPIDSENSAKTVKTFLDYFKQNVTFTPYLSEKFKTFFESSQNRIIRCGTFGGNEIFKRNVPDFVPTKYYVEPSKC